MEECSCKFSYMLLRQADSGLTFWLPPAWINFSQIYQCLEIYKKLFNSKLNFKIRNGYQGTNCASKKKK